MGLDEKLNSMELVDLKKYKLSEVYKGVAGGMLSFIGVTAIPGAIVGGLIGGALGFGFGSLDSYETGAVLALPTGTGMAALGAVGTWVWGIGYTIKKAYNVHRTSYKIIEIETLQQPTPPAQDVQG